MSHPLDVLGEIRSPIHRRPTAESHDDHQVTAYNSVVPVEPPENSFSAFDIVLETASLRVDDSASSNVTTETSEISTISTTTNSEAIHTVQICKSDLGSFFRLIKQMGCSNYEFLQYHPRDTSRTLSLQSVYFHVFSTCAITDVIALLKSEVIGAIIAKKLTSCIRFGFALVRVINRGLFLRLVTVRNEKISVMLLDVENAQKHESQTVSENQLSRTSLLIITASTFMTVLTAVFGYSSLGRWSIQRMVGQRTFRFTRDLFEWSPSHYGNNTELLYEKYVFEDITTPGVMMSIVELIIQVCGTLQGELIRDLLVMVSLTLMHGWEALEERISSHLLIHPNNADDIEIESCLQQYKLLRQQNDSVNTAIGAVLNYVIIENLLLFAYFFVQIMLLEDLDIWLIHSLVGLVKTTALFYTALKIHWTNDNIKKWLRLMTVYKRSTIMETTLGMTSQAVVDDLVDNNVGLGKGYFLLNESFLVGFFAAVASIVSFLVESEDTD